MHDNLRRMDEGFFSRILAAERIAKNDYPWTSFNFVVYSDIVTGAEAEKIFL